MKITVVGSGYVGLVLGACLAETGNDVTCLDVDAKKIDGLKQNILPIYEPGLDALVARNQAEGRLTFTTDAPAAIGSAEVCFIAVGTPQDEDGSADLTYVLAVAESIGRHMQRELVVVTKSTVPVGTAAKVEAKIREFTSKPFHMCSNPEFLKEGAAVDDFLKPDRVVVGVATEFAKQVMGDLYAPFVRTGRPVIFMDIPSAEMTKYAANAMLATRISFMNEIAMLCEKTGADVDLVRKGIGSDARIGPSFLFPGPGYGGSCFPKDVQALVRTGQEFGAELSVVRAVHVANERQKHVLGAKVIAALGGQVRGARIAVWGLAFKPNTDDMREAPALVLVDELLAGGATVVAHDPVAMHEAERRLGQRVTFAPNAFAALDGADALVIVTDWNEYRHPDFARIKAALKRPVIVDGRNLYDPAKLRALGFTYDSIGRGR
jgi:UDPglucose 6-dehydrogenase